MQYLSCLDNRQTSWWRITPMEPWLWLTSSPWSVLRLTVVDVTASTFMHLVIRAWLYTHTHPFNGPLSGTARVSRYQKGKTNLDFTEPRDSEWQWHQLGHMQVCTSLQTDNHVSTPPLSFLQAGCPSCHPTNSVKALKAAFYAHSNSRLSNRSTLSVSCTLFT